jgi:hypothetical protein
MTMGRIYLLFKQVEFSVDATSTATFSGNNEFAEEPLTFHTYWKQSLELYYMCTFIFLI